MHIYKYFQSHIIIIIHQQGLVSGTPGWWSQEWS